MKQYLIMFMILIIAFSITLISVFPNAFATASNEIVVVTVDLQTILLEPNQIIPLLDTKSVGNMSKLQISVTLPCESNNTPKLKIFAGALGKLQSVIDSNDYKNLRGSFNSCYYEDTISLSSNLPVLNKVFLNNTGTSSVVTNLGTVVSISGLMNVTQPTSSLPSSGTLLFFTDYSSADGWTQTGTTVTVDSGSFPDILKFNGATGNSGARVHSSLPESAPDSYWVAEFEFKVDSLSTGDAVLFALTDNTNGIDSSQDRISVWAQDVATKRIHLNYKDGTTNIEGSNISLTLGNTYYAKLERASNTVTLSIFGDAGRTAHVSGSPVTDSISSATITNLGYLQHGVRLTGDSGSITAHLDNTKILK